MSKWKKCLVYEDDFSMEYYIDADTHQNQSIEDIKRILGLEDTHFIEYIRDIYYDANNWVIKNVTRSPINCISICSYFSYLYNSNKPEYPIKDSSYFVYVAFEDTTKVGNGFTLDLSNFNYTGEKYRFDPSGMFYGCPAEKIVGLDHLPPIHDYNLVFYNLENIKHLNISEMNCYSFHSEVKGLDFEKDTQKFCQLCTSLESLDMSHLSFVGNGNNALYAIFANLDKELLCGDWSKEESRLSTLYKSYSNIPFVEKDGNRAWELTQFIDSQFWANDNLQHVNLFGIRNGLYIVLIALSKASRNDKDVLNIYVDKDNYKTALDFMYIISRHLVFWDDSIHWRSIRIIPVEGASEWEEYRKGIKDVSKVGKIFNFHYYDYFQSDQNKCLEEVRRLLEQGKSDIDIIKELSKRYSNINILNALGSMGKGTSVSLSYCKRFILPDINNTVGLRRDSESKLSIGEVAELLYKKYPRTLVNEAIVLYLKDQHIIL